MVSTAQGYSFAAADAVTLLFTKPVGLSALGAFLLAGVRAAPFDRGAREVPGLRSGGKASGGGASLRLVVKELYGGVGLGRYRDSTWP
jgi:hypothetical protein